MLLAYFIVFLCVTDSICEENASARYESELQELRHVVQKQQQMIDSLSAKLEMLSNGAAPRVKRQEERVAFTAYLDHREQEHPHMVIKFNRILYNLGNAYNKYTGIFTAPITGTYLFAFQIEEWDTPEIVCDLKVDGVNQVGSVLNPGGTSAQSGNTAVLGLTKGQSVWVEARGQGRFNGEVSFAATSFTGLLLY